MNVDLRLFGTRDTFFKLLSLPPFVIKRKFKEAIKHKRIQETKKIHETSEFMMGNSWQHHLVSNWLENSKTMQTLVSLDSWAVIVGERNPSLHIDHGHQGRWNEFLLGKPFRKWFKWIFIKKYHSVELWWGWEKNIQLCLSLFWI